jgi:hypothetical protein
MSDQLYDAGGFAANFGKIIREIVEILSKSADDFKFLGLRLLRCKEWIIENYGLIILIAGVAFSVVVLVAWTTKALKDSQNNGSRKLSGESKKDERRFGGRCPECGISQKWDGESCGICGHSDKDPEPDSNKLA